MAGFVLLIDLENAGSLAKMEHFTENRICHALETPFSTQPTNSSAM